MHLYRERLSIYICASFPYGFKGEMWDLIVLVPGHCLSFDSDDSVSVQHLGATDQSGFVFERHFEKYFLIPLNTDEFMISLNRISDIIKPNHQSYY